MFKIVFTAVLVPAMIVVLWKMVSEAKASGNLVPWVVKPSLFALTIAAVFGVFVMFF